MTEIQINKLKKRDIVTQLEKLVPISRPSLLKLSKKELVELLKEKIDSQSESNSVKQPISKTDTKKVKSKRPNKKRLLDFSSDEEDDETQEIIETIPPEKEPVKDVIEQVHDTQVAKKTKPKTKQKIQKIQIDDEESEEEVKEPEVKEPEVKELEVKEPEVKGEKTKLMKEIKAEIKNLMKDFSSNISKTILEFKKTEDQTTLIDTHNELRSEYESEVKLILDENKSKVTDALLDYVDSLFTTQFNRVDRLL